MTNEQNFKKGDKVRYIGKYPCYVRTDISKDETYTVREINGDMCFVDVPTEAVIYVNDFELVEHIDRRTAFLRRLGALLREFDAVIDIAADYGYSVGLSLRLNGEEVIHDREVIELHADNIMDFDKE